MEPLKLPVNNLYSNGRLILFTDGSDEMLLERDLLAIPGSEEDRYYTLMEGDRLELLAWQAWNKQVKDASKYWWILADANNIFNPLDLTEWVGKDILIPDILKLKLTLEE
jgi:hypothetical protein